MEWVDLAEALIDNGTWSKDLQRKFVAAVRLAKRGFEHCATTALYAPEEDHGELIDALKAARATACQCLVRLRSGEVEDKP